jgi:hypothetical protein
MTNQMVGLLGLAWKKCEWDMAKLFGLYVGGWIFAITVLAFALLNMALNFGPLVTEKVFPDVSGTILGATLMSFEFGIINAVYTLTFLFIIVSLFEFTYAFLRVAYEYDDCSWEIVKFPYYCNRELLKLVRWADSLGKENRIAAAKARKEEADALHEAIHNLKMSAMLDEITTENSKMKE